MYFVAGNRAFETRAAAEEFCAGCDWDLDIIEEKEG